MKRKREYDETLTYSKDSFNLVLDPGYQGEIAEWRHSIRLGSPLQFTSVQCTALLL